jgi:hypothetical protein
VLARFRYRFKRLPLVAAVVFCCALSGHAADVSLYLVERGLEYIQTNANPPTVNVTNGYGFAAEVDLTTPGVVTNASILPPLGVPSQTLSVSSSGNKRDYSKKYNTLASLLTHYPDGDYTFTIKAEDDGVSHPVLSISGTTFPNGPRVNNYPELKSVNPNGYIRIGWDEWPNGGTDDYIQLRVVDGSGNKLYETPDLLQPGAYDGSALWTVIGPGTLNTGQVNTATLLFQKRTALDTNAYPGSQGIAARYSRTKLSLTTSRAAPPDVSTYELSKEQRFVQSGPSTIAPEAGSEFVFTCTLHTYQTGVIAAAALAMPPAASQLAMTNEATADKLSFSDTRTSSALLEAAYPAGTYSLGFNASHDGAKAIALALPAAAYPPAPRFSNFASLTNVNTALPLTVSWHPWVGGTCSDYIHLRIEDTGGTKLFETADLGDPDILDGRATNIVIPASTLPIGKDLQLRLSFIRFSTVDASLYPGVLGMIDFQSRTKVSLKTFYAAQNPSLSLVQLPGSGAFELVLTQAVPGLSYRIEGSSNLLNWAPLATNKPATNVFQLLDDSRHSAWFYRAVVLP